MKKLLICGCCGGPVVFRRLFVFDQAVLASGDEVEEDGRVHRGCAEGLWCDYCGGWRTQKQSGGDELLILLASGVLKIGSEVDSTAGQDRLLQVFEGDGK
jgi:hypothetical protein